MMVRLVRKQVMIQGRWIGLSGLLAMLLALFVSLAAPAAAADCPGKDAVLAATQSFLQAARKGSPAAFSAALARHAPVADLALQALGPYRNRLPPTRRAEFQRNALTFMGRFVAENAGGLRDAKLKIVACRGNIIESTASGEKVTWRVSGSSIVDVKVRGFSLTGQMRTKFVKVIRLNRGDVGALIDFLGRG
jgi:ABC-type transporter MlaC component